MHTAIPGLPPMTGRFGLGQTVPLTVPVIGQPGHPVHPLGMGGHVGVPRQRPAPAGADPPPPPWSPGHTNGTGGGPAVQDDAARAERESGWVWANIRARVVDRLLRMNVRHGLHAWEYRRDRPVAPWAVAFLYARPLPPRDGEPVHYAVAAATRMVNDDPDLPSAAHLLLRLTELARDRYLIPAGRFDPTVMTTHQDPVDTTAFYLGVGLSCLGLPDTPWAQLSRGDSNDIPGQGLALLTDGTALLVERGTRRDLNLVTLHATAPLTVEHGLRDRSWIHHDTVTTVPAPVQVWEQLHALHTVTGGQPHPPTLDPPR